MGRGHRNDQRCFYNREKFESVAELNEKLKKASAMEQQVAYAHIERQISSWSPSPKAFKYLISSMLHLFLSFWFISIYNTDTEPPIFFSHDWLFFAAVLQCGKNLLGEVTDMKHINTIETRNLCESAKNGGCGECQTSCQSACKTSCGIANQACENKDRK